MRKRHQQNSATAVTVNLFVLIGVVLPVKALLFTATRVIPLIVRGATNDLYRMRLRIQLAYLIWKRDH